MPVQFEFQDEALTGVPNLLDYCRRQYELALNLAWIERWMTGRMDTFEIGKLDGLNQRITIIWQPDQASDGSRGRFTSPATVEVHASSEFVKGYPILMHELRHLIGFWHPTEHVHEWEHSLHGDGQDTLIDGMVAVFRQAYPEGHSSYDSAKQRLMEAL